MLLQSYVTQYSMNFHYKFSCYEHSEEELRFYRNLYWTIVVHNDFLLFS